MVSDDEEPAFASSLFLGDEENNRKMRASGAWVGNKKIYARRGK